MTATRIAERSAGPPALACRVFVRGPLDRAAAWRAARDAAAVAVNCARIASDERAGSDR
jgi:hypothetical protein